MLRCPVLAFEKLDPNQSLEVALLLAQTSLFDKDHPKDISGEILYSPIITRQWYDKKSGIQSQIRVNVYYTWFFSSRSFWRGSDLMCLDWLSLESSSEILTTRNSSSNLLNSCRSLDNGGFRGERSSSWIYTSPKPPITLTRCRGYRCR